MIGEIRGGQSDFKYLAQQLGSRLSRVTSRTETDVGGTPHLSQPLGDRNFASQPRRSPTERYGEQTRLRTPTPNTSRTFTWPPAETSTWPPMGTLSWPWTQAREHISISGRNDPSVRGGLPRRATTATGDCRATPRTADEHPKRTAPDVLQLKGDGVDPVSRTS